MKTMSNTQRHQTPAEIEVELGERLKMLSKTRRSVFMRPILSGKRQTVEPARNTPHRTVTGQYKTHASLITKYIQRLEIYSI